MWKNLGFFHLATPKTAFLVRNLPIDTRNLGIFPTNRVIYFSSQKRTEEASPSSLASEPRKINFGNEKKFEKL